MRLCRLEAPAVQMGRWGDRLDLAASSTLFPLPFNLSPFKRRFRKETSFLKARAPSLLSVGRVA